MSDPTTIANLLHETLVSKTQAIKKAEQSLENLQNDPNFLSHLLLIPKQMGISRDIRKSAVIYTKKYAKNRLLQKNQQKINNTAEQLLNALSESVIQLPLRRHLSKTLQYLLLNDNKNAIRSTLNTLCTKTLLEARIQQDSAINFEFIGFFSQILMSSFAHLTKQLNIFIQQTLIPFCQLNLRVYKYCVLSMQSGQKQKIMHIFRILRLYSNTIKLYLKRIMLSQLQTVKILYQEPIILLLSTSLDFILQNNLANTHIVFYNSQADSEVVQIFHYIKADYLQSLGFYMRTIFIQFKDPKMITASPILNSPGLIPSLVNGMSELLGKCPYNKIKSPALVKLMQEIINCLTYSVRNNFYFKQFEQYKQPIVHGIILRILSFSQLDCNTFVDDPEQFINQQLQIIEMDSTQYLKNKDNQILFSEHTDQIEEYSNLRTLASMFLCSYCKSIDGSLPQILNYSLSVLRNQIQSQFPKSLLLIMVSILRDQIIARQAKGHDIVVVACELLKNKKIPEPIIDTEASPLALYEQNIQYLMLLLTVFRYLSKLKQVLDAELTIISKSVYALLVHNNISEALKISALDLVVSICERQQIYESQYILIINQILGSSESSRDRQHLLQTLANIYKYSSSSYDQLHRALVQTIGNLSKLVESQVVKKQLRNQLIINKCWNIISDISQNPVFIPKLIPEIEQAVMPLLQYIDGKQNVDYEQDIFMMMSSFISKSKSVTSNELVMFQIIPKLFYTQYQYRFGHAFQTLQIFMYYGSSILINAPMAMKAIIEMSVYSMNLVKNNKFQRSESQNCEGVLTLQSLILSCGNAFTSQYWVEIAKALNNRLENPVVTGNILRSNIIATLALIIMLGYKSFSLEDCDVLLNKILQNHYSFVVSYSIKVIIIALSQILCLFNLPFVANRYTYLLDSTLTLLQGTKLKQEKRGKDSNFIKEDEQDYQVSISTIKNMITELDQLQHFKNKMFLIKEQNPSLLQKTIGELAENKINFLKSIMNVVKVSNEARPIFKIKRQ